MHWALEIVEIVDMICGEIRSSTPTATHSDGGDIIFEGPLRHLAVLARTSTVFHNTALDHLWNTQDTILNLLRCMPNDLWRINDGLGVPKISLLRSIASSDWQRPLIYSHRVKSFLMHQPESSDFLQALSLFLLGDCIFPNLQNLRWLSPLPSSFHHISLFITPSIRHLSLLITGSFSQLSILSNLGAKCPALTHVAIYIATSQGTFPTLSTFARSLMHVQSLTIPLVDRAALEHLSQLPHLQSLQFTGSFTPEFSLTPTLASIPFPALIHLTMYSLQCGTTLLTWSKHLTLKTLNIRGIQEVPTKIDIRRFYAAIALHCAHPHLQEIIVGTSYDDVTPPGADEIDTYSVGRDMIEPLFPFANLVTVSLIHPVGFDLDDATILKMARSWPRLQSLFLTARPFHHMPSRVTLEGVYAFAEHCPRLRTLGITVDATSVPKIRIDKEQPRVTQLTLATLHVALSLIGNAGRVAVFLSAIFPELRWIQTFYDGVLAEHEDEEEEEAELEVPAEQLESHKKWKAVEDALRQD
ncbi:hypothetical protein B0H17DRAFT_304113 [Mycena rosella]|uniref:F-box domain-containing protein n=1 Tax=Mycena rosella TaxID=1033263 RepID=A0AAD7G3I4_MYCRO|nr:hypothetical protein B0H17DRAFT_304113 [Mycena rosella]